MITSKDKSEEKLGIFQENFNRGIQLLSELVDEAGSKQIKTVSSSSSTKNTDDKIKFRVTAHSQKYIWSICKEDTIG